MNENKPSQKKLLYNAKMFRPSIRPIVTTKTFIENGVITTEVSYKDGFTGYDKTVISESLPRFTASSLEEINLEDMFRKHLVRVNNHLEDSGTNGNIKLLEFLPKIIEKL